MATVLHPLLLDESVPAGELFEVSGPIVYSIFLMEESLKMGDVEPCEIPSALAISFYESLAKIDLCKCADHHDDVDERLG
jgi:hypothetical protein